MAKLKLNTNAEPFEVELSGNCIVAGKTRSGKTVLLNDFVDQLKSDTDVDLYVVDAKGYEHEGINTYSAENAKDALIAAFNEATTPEHKEQVIIVDEYQAITDNSFFDMLDQLLEMDEYGIHVILASQGITPEMIYNIDQFDLRIVFDCREDVRAKIFTNLYPLHSFYGDHHYPVFRESTWSVADCKQKVIL